MLMLLWVFATWPWLVGGHYIPFDSLEAFYPQSRFVVDSLRLGDWPWWNPYQYSGFPVFGDPQGMIFTLHTVVGLAFGDRYSLRVFDTITLVHPLIGSLAIYALGRSLNVPRAWILTAALVFMLGGVATSRLQHVTQIVAYAWIPVLLVMQLRLVHTLSFRWAFAFGIAGALWASNANQVVFLGVLLFLGSVIYSLFRSEKPLRLSGLYFVSMLTAILLLLPVYAALLEIVALTGRAGLPLEASAASSFPYYVYASIFSPALFGNLGGPIWAPTDITMDYLYVGILPILLLLYGFAVSRAWRSGLVVLWVLGLVFYVLFSMGVHTPLYPLLFTNVPGFDFFRRPADAAYLVNILIAIGILVVGRQFAMGPSFHKVENPFEGKVIIVLGLGLTVVLSLIFHQVLQAEAETRDALAVLHESYSQFLFRVLFWLAILGVGFGIFRWRRLSSSAVIVTGALALVVDVAAAGRFAGTFSPHSVGNPSVASYESALGANMDPSAFDQWLSGRTAPGARVEIVGGFKSLGYSSALRWHHTQGYNAIYLEHYRTRMGAFLTAYQPRIFPGSSNGPLDWRYDALGLQYVAFHVPTLEGAKDTPVAVEAKRYRDLLEIAGWVKVFQSAEYQVWKRGDKTRWLSLVMSEEDGALERAPCEVEKYDNVRIVLECSLGDAGVLVMGEIYAPGWRASVNGAPAVVQPYFDVFRRIDLPGGKSKVELRYYPVPFFRF